MSREIYTRTIRELASKIKEAARLAKTLAPTAPLSQSSLATTDSNSKPKGKTMPPASNTFTVTFADTHAHTAVFAGVPGKADAPDGGKADALLSVMQTVAGNPAQLSALATADTLTVTVTQP